MSSTLHSGLVLDRLHGAYCHDQMLPFTFKYRTSMGKRLILLIVDGAFWSSDIFATSAPSGIYKRGFQGLCEQAFWVCTSCSRLCADARRCPDQTSLGELPGTLVDFILQRLNCAAGQRSVHCLTALWSPSGPCRFVEPHTLH